MKPTTPLRFHQFAGAYVVLAVALALAPWTEVVPGVLQVDVRQATAAGPLDLAYEPEPVPRAPIRNSASPLVEDPSNAAPVRILIPSVGIDGPVVPVGIAPDRQLDVPFAKTAGWYQHSSLPSASGASVIAAHVDYSGSPGLFFNLRLTEIGSTITLQQPDGSSRDYRVTSVVLYDKDDLPAAELFRTSGDHALHLVTCGGTFDRSARSYRGNQVITAVPVT